MSVEPNRRYLCCCCSFEFDSLGKVGSHSCEKFFSIHGFENGFNICGLNVWFCFGCQKFYRCYEEYKDHFQEPMDFDDKSFEKMDVD